MIRAFQRDETGISMTEAMLIVPVMMLVTGAMIEFGVAMFQWNQSVKAVQIGARLAAVSSPLVGDSAYDTALTADYGTIPGGDPTPGDPASVACGAGTTACVTARINRLLSGSDSNCGPPFSAMTGMCDLAPWISAENVLITYSRSGLGYVGRPAGPVSTITVELRNLTFDFFILDSLIPGLGNIEIPSHPVTITSEDINDCRDTCP